MASLGSVDHRFPGGGAPVHIVSGIQSKLTDEFALGSPVAFAKGMSCIQLAEKVRGVLRELVGVQGEEKIPELQFAQRLR